MLCLNWPPVFPASIPAKDRGNFRRQQRCRSNHTSEWDSVDHRDHTHLRSMLIFTVQGLWQHVKQIAHQSPSSIGPRGGGCPRAADIRTSGRTQTEAEPWSQQTRLSHWGAGLTLHKALIALTTLGLGVQSGKALFCWIQVQCKHRELLWSYFAATGLHPTHFPLKTMLFFLFVFRSCFVTGYTLYSVFSGSVFWIKCSWTAFKSIPR